MIKLSIPNPRVDREIKALLHRLGRNIENELNEIEKLLRIYLAAMLDKTHRQLIKGSISLSEYYRDTQILAHCGEKIREED